MFKRQLASELLELINDRPAVALVGPRQVGKTTLVQMLINQFAHDPIYPDLESNEDLNRLQDPELYLSERQDKLIIIDEIQRMPQLFPLLRSLIDRHRVAGRFMLLLNCFSKVQSHWQGALLTWNSSPLPGLKSGSRFLTSNTGYAGAIPICCWRPATDRPADA